MGLLKLENFDDYVKWNLNGKVFEAIKCAGLAAGSRLGAGAGAGAGIDWWEGPITGGWPDPALGVITLGSTDSGTAEL